MESHGGMSAPRGGVRRWGAVLPLGAVFLAGALVRVWFVARGPRAFDGFTDAWAYVGVAGGHYQDDRVHPVGYPFFLRAAHVISANISWTIVLQHALGLATAALLYASVRRLTGSRAVAVIAAAFILLDGVQIVLEHTLLTETFFVFVVAAFTYALLRALDGRWTWIALSGVLAAAAGLVKSVGLLLLLLTLVALLGWHPATSLSGWRGRIAPAAAAAAAAIIVLAVYLAILSGEPGSPKVSVSPASGRVLYSRVAPFANCAKFTPPAGAAGLCQKTAPASRPGTNFYLWDGTNPAWRTFGPPPAADGTLRDFALSAIAAQPGAYVSAVWKDLRKVVDPGNSGYVDLALDRLPIVVTQTKQYYDYAGTDYKRAGAVLPYARAIFVDNVLMTILLALPVLSLVLTRGAERRGTLIFAITGWTLILGAVATANYDPRYAAVAVGFLAAASAPTALRAARRARSIGPTLRRHNPATAATSQLDA